jgi:mRNA interferase MazF
MNFKAGDVVAVDFPGVNGVKRRPAIVLSSITYHKNRSDVIVGLLTSQSSSLGIASVKSDNMLSFESSLSVQSIVQSTIVNPGTCSKSRRLHVTTVAPIDSAIAAIRISF